MAVLLSYRCLYLRWPFPSFIDVCWPVWSWPLGPQTLFLIWAVTEILRVLPVGAKGFQVAAWLLRHSGAGLLNTARVTQVLQGRAWPAQLSHAALKLWELPDSASPPRSG